MNSQLKPELLNDLKHTLDGDLFTEEVYKLMYATDASVYRELPLAVVYPRSPEDIQKLIIFAGKYNVVLIPRGAGTSLAGQVVGEGIIVDVSRYLNRIIEINEKEKWVRVQPGVVLDELNLELKKRGLFFAPETSTSNRCVIGGMIGNNSSGLHSLIYGTTRDHLKSAKVLLSDGSKAEFGELTEDEFNAKCALNNLEGDVYRFFKNLFSQQTNIEEIDKEFPDKRIIRRNTGYALDELSYCYIFRNDSHKRFNLCKLLSGSEGTLAFVTEATLNLLPLPPPQKALVCVHVNSVIDAIRANLIALEYKPSAVELMDKKILDCTLENIEQRKNRFFIKGDPGAILIVEFFSESMEEILQTISSMEKKLRAKELGYHFPVITGANIKKVWNLRKAGLGVLSNMPGDARPVSVIEDTSVHPENLEKYILDFNRILEKNDLECVYHAHISVGELHLRPVLNLKDEKDILIFRQIAYDTARLVKKYKGSLSGEHGDGRVRGHYIPLMFNETVYQWFIDTKKVFDPSGIFNKGKITNTPDPTAFLRYLPGQTTRKVNTILDFSGTEGILRAIEKCNGSGDCRKSALIGGTMCPSYMATKEENHTTRARANLFREFFSNSIKKNPFNHKEVFQVLDTCLSCKGCKSECPSNVDMTKLKAEFLHQYYKDNTIPLRTWLIANITLLNRIGSFFPFIYNFVVSSHVFSGILKKSIGFAKERSLPLLQKTTLKKWMRKKMNGLNSGLPSSADTVYFFIDEFTNYNDTAIGIKTILLLNRLGYKVLFTDHAESGRTFISKGLLTSARKRAIRNINAFSELINEKTPLIGLEPSAILSFRDEYPDLVRGKLKEKAIKLAKNVFILEEFLANEMNSGKINKELFTRDALRIKVHGHCHQKSIASVSPILQMLSFPENYIVEEIPSGCCGMAGSFGYEKEHYELSMSVGELILFPEIRKTSEETVIAAPGTSCRQQIKDGTGKSVFHPVEILYMALNEDVKIEY